MIKTIWHNNITEERNNILEEKGYNNRYIMPNELIQEVVLII